MGRKKGTVKRLNEIFSEIGLESIPNGDEMSFLEAVSVLEESGESLEMQGPHAPLETCGTHGKACYRSIREAREVIKKRRNQGSGPLREYRCPDCGFHHISSSI